MCLWIVNVSRTEKPCHDDHDTFAKPGCLLGSCITSQPAAARPAADTHTAAFVDTASTMIPVTVTMTANANCDINTKFVPCTVSHTHTHTHKSTTNHKKGLCIALHQNLVSVCNFVGGAYVYQPQPDSPVSTSCSSRRLWLVLQMWSLDSSLPRQLASAVPNPKNSQSNTLPKLIPCLGRLSKWSTNTSSPRTIPGCAAHQESGRC